MSGLDDGPVCCADGCCGPGSYCCAHANPHTHDELEAPSMNEMIEIVESDPGKVDTDDNPYSVTLDESSLQELLTTAKSEIDLLKLPHPKGGWSVLVQEPTLKTNGNPVWNYRVHGPGGRIYTPGEYPMLVTRLEGTSRGEATDLGKILMHRIVISQERIKYNNSRQWHKVNLAP